jgi:uncharacterized protein (TIGR02996 family)
MTDHHAFLSAIVANPDDPTPRLIYADKLLEEGNPEWEAWHWLGAFNRRPWAQFERGRCSWEIGNKITDVVAKSGLPLELFKELRKAATGFAGEGDGFTDDDSMCFVFPSIEKAFHAIVAAFLAARRTGWKPNWPDASQGETSPFITNRETKE